MLRELDHQERGRMVDAVLFLGLLSPRLPPLPGEPSALAFNGSEVAWVRLFTIS